MTLRDKFDSISCSDCDMPYCDVKCTILNKRELHFLEKIADDYAVDFGEWLLTNGKKYNEYLFEIKDSKELLEIFKKEKGL